MKTDSANELQTTLHDLQTEIKSLSDQQMQMATVQHLQQEIRALQNGVPTAPETPDENQGKDMMELSADCVSESPVSLCMDLSMEAPPSSFSTNNCPSHDTTTNQTSDISFSDADAKADFMACLQLITLTHLKELQNRKRLEQKRYFNVYHSITHGHLDSEVEVREDCCVVCRRSGELLMCDVCSAVYHLQCLDPPLTSVPSGLWSCPKCQALGKLCGGKDDWPSTLALVHSYLMHKAAREEERTKARKQVDLLIAERKQLELRAAQLAKNLQVCAQRRNDFIDAKSKAEKAYESLRGVVLEILSS